MSNKKASALLLVFVLFSALVNAQSIYLEKGQGGYEAGVSSFLESGDFSFSTFAGYSLFSLADIEVALGGGFFNLEGDLLKKTVKYYRIAPGISFVLLRQNEKVPVNAEAGYVYHYTSYTSSEMEEAGIEIDEKGSSVQLYLSRKILMSENVTVLPELGFSYNFTASRIKDAEGDSGDENKSFPGFSANAAFMINNSDDMYLILKPGIGVKDEKFSAGIIFSALYGRKR